MMPDCDRQPEGSTTGRREPDLGDGYLFLINAPRSAQGNEEAFAAAEIVLRSFKKSRPRDYALALFVCLGCGSGLVLPASFAYMPSSEIRMRTIFLFVGESCSDSVGLSRFRHCVDRPADSDLENGGIAAPLKSTDYCAVLVPETHKVFLPQGAARHEIFVIPGPSASSCLERRISEETPRSKPRSGGCVG